jgi:RNA polymerase sigma factor (TIGR02999 family)
MVTHPQTRPFLAEAGPGRREALDEYFPLVYEELHALAHRQLGRFRPGETLCTTALVHEAYVKLVERSEHTFYDRGHFFSGAALAMRHIVVDYARRRAAQKRGGGCVRTFLDDIDRMALPIEAQAAALVALDDALTRLSQLDERLVRVVELRFFGGLSVEETAGVLDISTATVKRDTRAARAFIVREVGAPEGR